MSLFLTPSDRLHRPEEVLKGLLEIPKLLNDDIRGNVLQPKGLFDLLPLGDLTAHLEKGLSAAGCLVVGIHFPKDSSSDIPHGALGLSKGTALLRGQIRPDLVGFLNGLTHHG